VGFLGRHILFYHPQAAALKQRAAALMVGYLRLRASVHRLLINFKYSIDFAFPVKMLPDSLPSRTTHTLSQFWRLGELQHRICQPLDKVFSGSGFY
jgi:hypothetical protein